MLLGTPQPSLDRAAELSRPPEESAAAEPLRCSPDAGTRLLSLLFCQEINVH